MSVWPKRGGGGFPSLFLVNPIAQRVQAKRFKSNLMNSGFLLTRVSYYWNSGKTNRGSFGEFYFMRRVQRCVNTAKRLVLVGEGS